jgi:hypothetical protein
MNRIVKKLINTKELTFVIAGNPQQNSAPKKDQAT